MAGAHVKDAHRPTPRLHAINGCGTTLLDYRPQEEGTYLATRWFTLFYLPILPLSAMRVRPIQREGQFGRETYRVEILSLAQLDPMRVLRTYLLTLLAVGPALFAFCRMDSINRWFGSGPGFVVNLATLIWFGFLLYKISNSDHLFRRKSA
ncbi:MAG: hypothetical protein JWN14_3447 [Chthonomonadales bacterium]|nr:hypothetical protein [Chthonomonadales bacterium]